LIVTINKNNYLISNIYRSPTPFPGLSVSDQLEQFVTQVDQMLSNFSNFAYPSIILTDSNLNLLKIKENAATESYVNTVHSNGFLFVQNKATRHNQDNLAHIDHIFTNAKLNEVTSGVIIDDLSDHYPNFIQMPMTLPKPISLTLNLQDPLALIIFRLSKMP
jgi:hypothetical protein